MNKNAGGRFFEEFDLGETLRHAPPRTLTYGDAALYGALYGTRFAPQASEAFARRLGYLSCPLDDLLVFHAIFGMTVRDVSLNAIANLGYAEGRFRRAVHAGETLFARSTVIGLKENSSRRSGIVYVRTEGLDESGSPVLDYVRWVMVRKRDPDASVSETRIPDLSEAISAEALDSDVVPSGVGRWDDALSGSSRRWGDYEVGERIDHVDGVTIEESEHMLATRLHRNSARVHFDSRPLGGESSPRLVYGGHAMSLVRALSVEGLSGAFRIAALNGGTHASPLHAGDTLSAWSEILDVAPLSGRDDAGALRIRSVGVKNRLSGEFPLRGDDGRYEEGVVLDLDYWVVIPR